MHTAQGREAERMSGRTAPTGECSRRGSKGNTCDTHPMG